MGAHLQAYLPVQCSPIAVTRVCVIIGVCVAVGECAVEVHLVVHLLPSLGPVRGQSAPCNIIVCPSVCVCVCSLHKCMSFKQQFEWRLHVTSRPKLLVRPIRLWSPTPCQLVSIVLVRGMVVCESIVYALALRSASWVAVAHSVPGRLNRFDCSLELASQVRILYQRFDFH